MNQAERWFGLLTDKLIRRDVHASVQALENDIREWIATRTTISGRSPGPRPDEILDSLAHYLAKVGAGSGPNKQD